MHFLLGRAWMNQGWDQRAAQRVEGALGTVLELGKRSEWYDGALFALAQFHEQHGRWQPDEQGNLRPVQDYRRAHLISGRNRHGDASTEELREAIVCYRRLFAHLVGIDERVPAEVTR